MRNLHKIRLAYQQQLLFMEFKVTVDKIAQGKKKVKKGEKLMKSEVAGFYCFGFWRVQ